MFGLPPPQTRTSDGRSIDALRDRATLEAACISHVLSVICLPMDTALVAGFEHLAIDADDAESENLIQHFAQTNAFIAGALSGDGRVLIHW